MGQQAEDISKIEDIGERLDALLDALETSSQEVAKVGSSLNVPLDQLQAQELATQPGAVVDDSGRVQTANKKEAAPPEPVPEPVPGTTPQDVSESSSEAIPEAAPEPHPPTQVEEEAPRQGPDAHDEGVSVSDVSSPESDDPSAEPEDRSSPSEQPGTTERDENPAETVSQVDAPDNAERDEGPIVDDGLLIEPEAGRASPQADDIDGAPAGPATLEKELDEELEALLASGMFEDPLEEAGIDESAAPLDLPEEPAEPQAAEPEAGERKPNLPTNETELIGELDEQLAALADMQLSDPELPAPGGAPSEPATPRPAPEPVASPETPTEQPKPAAPAAPQVAPQPVKLPEGRPGWRGRLERAISVMRPHAQRAWAGAQRAAIAGATRASAPLRDKPAVLQVVGWVGLVHLFMAACVWMYLLMWHNPPPPPPATAQPALQSEAR